MTLGERITLRLRRRPPIALDRDPALWGRYEMNLAAKEGMIEDARRRNAALQRHLREQRQSGRRH